MLLKHVGRMGRDIIQHAVGTRSLWVLVVLALISVGVVVTAAVQVLTPVVLYPFL